MKKRFYLIIFTLLLTITLVACTPKNTYKLTLPEFVTSDVSDTNKVLDETLVTLTVSERDGFVLDELKANDVLLNVSNNKATFIMKEDTVISVSFTVLGEGVYYKLTLGDNITANISNLDEILENTNIVIKVNVPDGKLIDQFLVNNVKETLNDNNEFTFDIKSNSNITVTFKDDPNKELDVVDILLLIKNLNPEILKSSDVNNFSFNIIDEDYGNEVDIKLLIDLNPEIEERIYYFLLKEIYDDSEYALEQYGKDSKLYYYDDYEEETIENKYSLTNSGISLLLSSTFNLGDFIIHPTALNDAIKTIFTMFKDDINEDSIIKDIKGKKIDDTYELKLSFGKESFDDFYNMFGEYYFGNIDEEELEKIKEQYENFQIDFTVSIKDNNIVGFLVDFEILEYKGKLSYTTTNNIDFEYVDIDKAISNPGYNVKIYDNDDLMLEINEEEDIDYLNEINLYYKEGLKFEGLYFDKELTKPFDNRALVEDLVLYIKYSELITIDEYRERIGEEWAFVDPDYSYYYYYENSDYLLIKYRSDDIFVLDKANNKGYLNSNGEYLLVDGNTYIKSIRLDINLKSFINSEFILIANNYFSKDNINNFINESEEIYYEGNTYKLLTDDELSEYSDFNFDEFLENEFMEDRIVYFDQAVFLKNDLDNLELFMDSLFIVQYSSDIRMELTLKELSKNHEVSIIHSDEEGIVNVEITIDQIKLYYRVLNYKSSKGLALYKEHVQEEQLFYYNDIKDFDELLVGEKFDFMKNDGIMINGILVRSLEEIKQFEDLKIVRFSLAYTHNSLEEIINNLKDKTIALEHGFIYYDFKTNIMYLRGIDGESSLELVKDKFLLTSNYSSIEFNNNQEAISFLNNYYQNYYGIEFSEYLTIIKILKGEIALNYNDEIDAYDNDNYLLEIEYRLRVTNKNTYRTIYIEVLDEEITLEKEEFKDTTIITNDLNSDIYTIKYNDSYYFNLEFLDTRLDYSIIGLFLDGELVENQLTNSNNYLIKYQKVMSPNEFFNDLTGQKGLIFMATDGYTQKIIPGLQQEVYYGDRLEYLIRKENGQYLTYFVDGNDLFLLRDVDYVLNILLLIELYKDREFIIKENTYINDEKLIDNLDKIIYTNSDIHINFNGRYISVDLKSIAKDEFEKLDFNDFTVIKEEIEDVYIEEIVSFDEILLDKDYPMITLEYNWGGIKKVSLEYLIENYNLTYQIDKEGLIIKVIDNEITKEFILSVFDKDEYGKTVVFYIDGQEYFVYLEDLLEFDYLEKVSNGVFIGFSLNNKKYETIEELEEVISASLSNEVFHVEILYEITETIIRENLMNLMLSMNLTANIDHSQIHFNYKNNEMYFESNSDFEIRYIKENEFNYEIYFGDSFFIIDKRKIANYEILPINYLADILNEGNKFEYNGRNEYYIYNENHYYEIYLSDNFDKFIFYLTIDRYKTIMFERSDEPFDIDFSIKDNYQLKINILNDEELVTEIFYQNKEESTIETLFYINSLLESDYKIFSNQGVNIFNDSEHYLKLLEEDEFDLFLDDLVIEVEYFNELYYDNYEIIYQMSNVQVLNGALGYLVDTNGIVIAFNDYYSENKLQNGTYGITFKINNYLNEYQLNIITAVSIEINYEIEVKYDNKTFEEIINSEKPSYETPFKAEPIIISNVKFYINNDGEYQRNIYIVNENNKPEINEHNSILIYYKNDLYEDLESYLDDEFYTVKIILKGVREDTNEWYADILEIN